MEIVKKPEGRKTDVRWGRGIEGFLDSPEPPNRGGNILEDQPFPRRGLTLSINLIIIINEKKTTILS